MQLHSRKDGSDKTFRLLCPVMVYSNFHLHILFVKYFTFIYHKYYNDIARNN